VVARPTLTTRELNRALLERQLLAKRRRIGARACVEHLVGLQAQVPLAPYVGLWSRIEGYTPTRTARMIERGELVRGGLMRNTLHLVTLADYRELRPLTKPILDRAFAGSTPEARQLAEVDLEALLREGAGLMEEGPRSAAELGRLLAESRPGIEPEYLARALRFLLPVIQAPPRGVWGRAGEARWQTVAQMTGQEPARSGDAQELMRRYLRAFGPASVRDFAAWSGLSGAAAVAEPMRGELRSFESEDGRELLDVPRAPLPGADGPASPRFLPEFDNVLVAYADRERVFRAEHRSRVIDGLGRRFVLIDGFVGAEWRLEREAGSVTLLIEPFERLGRAERDGLASEARALLAFLAPGSDRARAEIGRPG
jgi:hypothetical protein